MFTGSPTDFTKVKRIGGISSSLLLRVPRNPSLGTSAHHVVGSAERCCAQTGRYQCPWVWHSSPLPSAFLQAASVLVPLRGAVQLLFPFCHGHEEDNNEIPVNTQHS